MISWAKPNTIQTSSKAYPIVLLLNILLVTFLSVLATVTTLIADDVIQGELALSDRTATWLTTLNLLGINTVVPVASSLADRFGYKTILGIGLAIFISATLLAGFSHSFPFLGTARLLEGIGSGLIFPIGLATIVQNYPAKKLSLALILYISSTFGGGFAIGLPVAAYLTQFVSWRWIFFLTASAAFIGLISCSVVHEETEKKQTGPFDLLGYLCFATFVSSLLIGLTYGPMVSTNGGWLSPFILGCFSIAFLSIIFTLFIEIRHKNPVIPIVLFKNPIYAVSCAAMFLLGMSIFASVGTLLQYMIQALHYERFVSGKIGMMYGIPLALFSILANVLIRKIPTPVVTFLGLSILVYSYFLNNILDWQTGPEQILLILFLRGLGLGLSLGPTTIEALKGIPKELDNKAATLLTFFRQVGGTYGGTLVSIIVIKRTIFHTARFGEQANDQLPGFQVTFQKLYSHFHSTIFDPSTDTKALAKAMIIQNIEIQSYIQSINDAMIVFGYITSIIAVILGGLSLWNWQKSRKPSKIDL